MPERGRGQGPYPSAGGAVGSPDAPPAVPARAALHAALSAALQSLAESSTRPYYDADADAADAQRYYGGTGLEDLGRLLAATHRTQPRYAPASELYPWVDVHPDGTIRSLYTGQVWNPAELIVADFRIAAERLDEQTRRAAAGAAPDDRLAATIEEELPYNCEHVVPQSWFGKREPMRGDLHHLFACESRCNGFRGNTPFTEFADFPVDEAVRHDCGKSEAAGFEPRLGKGAVARATFYFCLRYPDVPAVDLTEPRRLRTLLAWHTGFPVTDWERHRNAAVFERQGNRNPCIDRPECVADLVAAVTGARVRR